MFILKQKNQDNVRKWLAMKARVWVARESARTTSIVRWPKNAATMAALTSAFRQSGMTKVRYDAQMVVSLKGAMAKNVD